MFAVGAAVLTEEEELTVDTEVTLVDDGEPSVETVPLTAASDATAIDFLFNNDSRAIRVRGPNTPADELPAESITSSLN